MIICEKLIHGYTQLSTNNKCSVNVVYDGTAFVHAIFYYSF